MIMERFELENIVGQSNSGVVYRAIDNGSKKTVAIHRFFPFGQNNGGLDETQSIVFLESSKRLANAQHPSLRQVIAGGTDPIDHIPYIVTEWVEGASLQTLMADEILEPGLVMDILRLALESSIAISETLEEEAIWVKTSVDSIVVGTENSNRGFTFCISPSKWLGAKSEGKDLLSLVKLGENLIGWEGRLVSDRSGHGLGGWFKHLKHHPDTSLPEALDSLNQLSEIAPQNDDSSVMPVMPYALRPVARPKKGAPKTTLAAVALLVVSVPTALLFYLHQNAKAPAVELGYSQQEITHAVADSDARPANTDLEASATFNDQGQTKMVANSARAPADPDPDTQLPELRRTSAALQSSRQPATVRPVLNEKKPPPILLQMRRKNGEWDTITEEHAGTLKQGTRVRMKGLMSKVNGSSSSIYLEFSSPAGGDSIRGVIRKREFEGKPLPEPEIFEKFLGETITLNGRIITQDKDKIPLVKIIKMSELNVGE